MSNRHGSTAGTVSPLKAQRGALEEAARLLTATDEYRVLRRFEPRGQYETPTGEPVYRALFVDVETTGLDPTTDAIIEFAAVPFTFGRESFQVTHVGEAISELEDPGREIPPKISRLTGLTNEMVFGRRLDGEAIAAATDAADVIIAHNAAFDRAFLERRFPSEFGDKRWACSLRDVAWEEYGYASGKLEFLLYQACGEFFQAHRAASDCYAGLHLLATPHAGSRNALHDLAKRAWAPTYRTWVLDWPFAERNRLKVRGYRWLSGSSARRRGWYVECDEAQAAAERAWLQVAAARSCVRVEQEFVDGRRRYCEMF